MSEPYQSLLFGRNPGPRPQLLVFFYEIGQEADSYQSCLGVWIERSFLLVLRSKTSDLVF